MNLSITEINEHAFNDLSTIACINRYRDEQSLKTQKNVSLNTYCTSFGLILQFKNRRMGCVIFYVCTLCIHQTLRCFHHVLSAKPSAQSSLHHQSASPQHQLDWLCVWLTGQQRWNQPPPNYTTCNLRRNRDWLINVPRIMKVALVNYIRPGFDRDIPILRPMLSIHWELFITWQIIRRKLNLHGTIRE